MDLARIAVCNVFSNIYPIYNELTKWSEWG